MIVKFWVKFRNHEPELYIRNSFDSFWYELRERMLKYEELRLEWIISE